MSVAPRPAIPPEIADPLAAQPVRIDPATLPTYEQALDQDLRNIGLFRAQERARRLRGVTDPLRAAGIEQTVELLGDDELLQRYGQASTMLHNMRRMPGTKAESRMQSEIARQEIVDAENPASAFATDLLAGVVRMVQDLGVSAYEVAGTIADVSPQFVLADRLFGTDTGDALREIAQHYRESVMSGEEAPSEFLRALNVKANRRGTWGVATGELLAQAMPSIGVAMRGSQAARRAMSGILWVYGTWSAGHGIEKYRRETLAEGRQPNAAVAALVGLGYGAAEIATEKLDTVIPWQTIATGSAHRVGEAILSGNARTAARYLVNSAGMAGAEGLEEVLAGELQSFVDAAAGVRSERTASDRLQEFAMGAAGSGLVSAAGIALPSFREAMTAPPTMLRSRGIDVAMAEDARAWLASDPGRKAAIPSVLSRLPSPPARAAGESVDVDAAVAEFQESLRQVGAERAIEVIPEGERSPSMNRSLAAWRRRGIEVVPIRPDPESPIPASPALSQPGVVLVEMTGTGTIDDVTIETGLIAHEAIHQLRATNPSAYSAFVEATAGPLMAAARQYVNAVQAQGLSAHAGTLLETPDLLIEEGGALLFQQMIEHAGLTSTLSGHQTGTMREVADFTRRTMSRLGLRGKAAQATLRAVEAMRAAAPLRPVQPPADVLAGIQGPRFAIRARKVSVTDRQAIEQFGQDLSTTLRDIEEPLLNIRTSAAIFAERHLGPKWGLRINRAASLRRLRQEIGQVAKRVMVKQSESADAAATAAVRSEVETQLRIAAKAADLRDAQLAMARSSVVDMIRRTAPKGSQAKLIQRAMDARTAVQFGRTIDALGRAVAKAAAQKAAKQAKQADRDATKQDRQLEEARIQAASSAMVAEMERSHRVASGAVTNQAGLGSGFGRMVRNLFTYGHFKPQTAAMYLFGEGTAMRVLYSDLVAAANRRLGIYQADTDHLLAALEAAGFKHGSAELAATSAVLSRAYGISLTRPGSSFHVKPIEHELVLDGGTISVTSAERITLLGLLRHEGTRRLVLSGTKIKVPRGGASMSLTANDIAQIEGTAPAWERAIVDAMQERYDGPMAGLLNQWSKDRLGEELSEPSYWPRRREMEQDIKEASWSRQNLQRMGLLQSKTKEKRRPILLTDAFADYLNHSWRIAGLSQLEEPVAFARSALSGISERASELGAVDGVRYFSEMLDRLTLEGMGHPGLVTESYIGRPAVWLRNNLVRGFLGLNPRVALFQLGGLVSAASRIDPSYLAAASGSLGDGRSIDAQIRRLSPMLRHRIESSGIGLVSESAAGSQTLLGFRGPGWMVMRGISWMDHLVVRNVWVAARLKIDREHPQSPDSEREVMAARLAEQVIVDTQPSFDVLHQSGVAREASRNALASVLTMFTSQFNAHANLLAKDAMAVRRQGLKAAPQLARSVGYTVVGNSLVVAGINAMIDAAISGLGGDEGDDRSHLAKFADQLQQNTVNLFYGGGALSAAISQTLGKPMPPGIGMSPPLDTMSSGIRGATRSAAALIERMAADTRRERSDSTDKILSGLDDAVQGLLPLGGVPITPYRLGKRVAGVGGKKKRKAASRTPTGTAR